MRWTEERITRLKELFAAGLGDEAISNELGCTKQAISIRRSHLGLLREPQRECLKNAVRTHGSRKRIMTNQGYTSKELEILTEAHKRGMTEKRLKKIAKTLKRTAAGVRSKFNRMFLEDDKAPVQRKLGISQVTETSEERPVVETCKENYAFIYAESLKQSVVPVIRIIN